MATKRTAKKELRKLIRHKLVKLSDQSVAEQSTAATASLLSMPEYKSASRISIYLSMPSLEIMTRALVIDALTQGKEVFVPFIHDSPVTGKAGLKIMEMVSLHSKADYIQCESQRDSWGIPSISADSVPERQRVLDDGENSAWKVTNTADERTTKSKETRKVGLDVIVMPGVAFDRKLARLGHGKGFYDHFLQRFLDTKVVPSQRPKPMPFLVGLALNEQVVSDDQEIPTDDSDWHLDALIAGDGSITQK